jgi:hypothetical protein
MDQRNAARVLLIGLMILAAGVFTLGIGWGLPSRKVDPLLFGEHPVWTGRQIVALTGERSDPTLGADVDPNPSRPGTILNFSDQQRAEIIRRYRLFTYQPDENVTMMALASMKPAQRDFDPKLYQYGGLWVYPVGALIKVLLNPQSQEHYLDHPEEFGRFYVIARLYAVAWGLLGVWAVFRIADKCGAGLLGSAGAALLYIFLPAVVNMSHEAKPHLPGAVLILLAARCAGRFVEGGPMRWGFFAGSLCGMSAGMVLTGAVSFVFLPAMVLMRTMSWGKRLWVLAGVGAVGVAVYFATNPYVLKHLVSDGAVLKSNLANSKAMYEAGRTGQGLLNALRLIWEGATPLVMVVGLLGAIMLWRRAAGKQAAAVHLLVIVSAVIVAQFVLLAAGKPGEYGRFALVPDITLALCAAMLIGRAGIRTFEKLESLGLLVMLAVLPSAIYLYGFARDSSPDPRRMALARQLERLGQRGAITLGVERDPAPYRLPPVNLFRWAIVRLPDEFDLAHSDPVTHVIVRPVDAMPREAPPSRSYVRVNARSFEDVFPARISWANKPMEIWVRKDLLGALSAVSE